MARRAGARVQRGTGRDRRGLIRHGGPLIRRRICVGCEGRHRHGDAREQEDAAAREQRQLRRAQHQRAEHGHHAEDGDLTADEHQRPCVRRVGERAEGEPERQRPVWRLVTPRRRDAEQRHHGQDRERAHRFDENGAAQPTHGRAPDRGGVAAERGQYAAACERGRRQRDQDERQLHHEQSPVVRAEQRADGADLRRRDHDAAREEHEDERERRAREASRRDDRVRPRVGTGVAAGRA